MFPLIFFCLFHFYLIKVFFMTHLWLWVSLVVWVSLAFISHAGVVVSRWPYTSGWLTPKKPVLTSKRSCCDSCHHRLDFISLIPVLGWIIRSGKCRWCGARVSARYPIIEAVFALLCGTVSWYFGVHMLTLWLLFLLYMSFLISWMDWAVLWIPERWSWTLVFLGMLYSPFESDITSRIKGFFVAFILFAVVAWLASKRRNQNLVAGGDMMLLGAGGAFFGVHHVSEFVLIVCGLYVVMYGIALVTGYRWTTQEEELKEMVGESSIFPIGPSIMAGLSLMMIMTAYGSISHHDSIKQETLRLKPHVVTTQGHNEKPVVKGQSQ